VLGSKQETREYFNGTATIFQHFQCIGVKYCPYTDPEITEHFHFSINPDWFAKVSDETKPNQGPTISASERIAMERYEILVKGWRSREKFSTQRHPIL